MVRLSERAGVCHPGVTQVIAREARIGPEPVIPAQAGIQSVQTRRTRAPLPTPWVPASAGTTSYFLSRSSRRRIFPTGVFGRSVRNSITRGRL